MYATQTRRLRPYLFTLLVVTFILHTLTGAAWLQYVEGVLALVSFAVSFHEARRMFQIVGGLFVAASFACMLWANIPLREAPVLMTKNVMLISLLYMLPFVNRAIRIGGYDRNLSRWLNIRSGHLGQLYGRTLIVSYLLSLFLFFAALPLLHRVLSKSFADGDRSVLAKRFMAMSILPGFGIVAVWSPVEPLVATAVVLTGVSYMSLLPWMLGLSFVLLAVGSLWGLHFRKVPVESTDTQAKAPSWTQSGAFLVALILLISSAFLVQGSMHVSFFAAMTLILLPFSAVWAVILRRLGRFVKLSRKQWKDSADGLKHLLVLFLSFGFFNATVAKTSVFDFMEGPVQLISQYPLLLFMFIYVIFLALPVIGVHPLVVMSLLGIFFQPVLEVISPLSLAVVMIICSLSSSFMGTFNSTVAIMGGLLQVNPYRVTVWNLSFGLVFAMIGVVAGWLLL